MITTDCIGPTMMHSVIAKCEAVILRFIQLTVKILLTLGNSIHVWFQCCHDICFYLMLYISLSITLLYYISYTTVATEPMKSILIKFLLCLL